MYQTDVHIWGLSVLLEFFFIAGGTAMKDWENVDVRMTLKNVSWFQPSGILHTTTTFALIILV